MKGEIHRMERDKPSAAQHASNTAFSSQQKKNAAEAERRFWSILRGKHIKGERFKHREPIGPYTVDFYCAGAKLVILLDDGLPDKGPQGLEAKMRWLSSQGYQVVRLKAEDVRRRPWPIVHQLARQFRLRDIPPHEPDEWNTGPSNQS
jgi:very-short-patch-repair endonuclease